MWIDVEERGGGPPRGLAIGAAVLLGLVIGVLLKDPRPGLAVTGMALVLGMVALSARRSLLSMRVPDFARIAAHRAVSHVQRTQPQSRVTGVAIRAIEEDEVVVVVQRDGAPRVVLAVPHEPTEPLEEL